MCAADSTQAARAPAKQRVAGGEVGDAAGVKRSEHLCEFGGWRYVANRCSCGFLAVPKALDARSVSSPLTLRFTEVAAEQTAVASPPSLK